MAASAKYNAYRFEGKVAVITAATSGIGLAIAHRLGHEGAKLVISSRSGENVGKAVEQLIDSGLDKNRVAGFSCHVANSEDRTQLLRNTLKQFGGRVHILVNNAGINPIFGELLDVDETAWDKLFQVNVKAGFLMSKLFAPEIERSGGGSILFNASLAAYRPPRALGAYSVTKAAVLALTKALALELAPKRIRVNAISPGVIRTRMSRALWEDNDSSDTFDSVLGRVGDPEECAGVAAFLCSDDASYITGESVVVAGGAHSRL